MFYAYTNGFIANDSNYGLPISMIDAHVDWDPVSNKWVDWSDQTKLKWTPPIRSIPEIAATSRSAVGCRVTLK
jgi:hypothetical protein